MQTYTNHIDDTLTESDLPRLAERLQLPDGWEYKSKKLDRDLVVDTKGLAHIVPDNLENMYQGYDRAVFKLRPVGVGEARSHLMKQRIPGGAFKLVRHPVGLPGPGVT